EIAPASVKPGNLIIVAPRELRNLLEAQKPSKPIWLDALDYALTAQQNEAAIRLIALLGQSRDETVLLGDGRPSSMVRGLASNDRAVRFAALEAIVRLNPTRPFVDSSLVPVMLGYFVNTGEAPKAVVAARNDEEAGRLAGLLAGLGYEAVATTTAAELFNEAK